MKKEILVRMRTDKGFLNGALRIEYVDEVYELSIDSKVNPYFYINADQMELLTDYVVKLKG